MTRLADDLILVRNAALPAGEVDGELIGLNIDLGECFGLDRIGTEIAAMTAEPISIAALISRITERYDVSEGQCRADLEPFLRDLIETGLIRIQP